MTKKARVRPDLLILILLMIVLSPVHYGFASALQGGKIARWQHEAGSVTIIRDDWGIAHVYGKTDADAVFGGIYAQAEDDFNRVETNYINAMGRLAEAEGESKIYQDLRMKLFIDPDALKKQYAESPEWLKKLMNAWADGLNYYLYKHPEVKPRVITRFEPWMALSFTEGSIGGDIERVNLSQLEDFYGKGPLFMWHAFPILQMLTPRWPSPQARTEWPSLLQTLLIIMRCCSSTRIPRSFFALSYRW